MFFKSFRKIIFITAFCIPFSTAWGQHFEVGLGGGSSNYFGDLAVYSSKGFVDNMHMNVTGFVKYNLNPYLTLGLSASYARVSGADHYAEDEVKRSRNLSFRSPISELALRVDFNILGYDPYVFRSPWSPYVFGGIAGFKFSPEAFYNGEWVDLQPLGTEGQGLEAYPEKDFYKLTEIAVPMGVGVKFALSEFLTLGFEIGFRMTFTDYIDDVSTDYVPYSLILEQRGEIAAALSDRRWEYLGEEPMNVAGKRGNSDNNDGYVFSVLSISYHFLDTGLGKSRARRTKKSGCYTL